MKADTLCSTEPSTIAVIKKFPAIARGDF